MTATSRHLFVLDPLEALNLAWDTSIKLAYMLTKMGAEVYCTSIHELVVTSHPTKVGAMARRMRFKDGPASVTLEEQKYRAFAEMRAVHMRKEPPYDTAYLESLWILAAGRHETKVLNDPIALQQMNEKLMLLDFAEYAKPMAVSANAQALAKFGTERCHDDVVVKPLNLYGGRGVVHFKSPPSLVAEIDRETDGGRAARLVQAFEPSVAQGEVRAFAVAGKPLAWCLKVPKSGDFLANTRAGSTLHKYTPNARDVEVVTNVATKLMAKGIVVAGFDMIGGWLSEINTTCPALLSPERESLEGFDELAKRLMQLC